MGRKIKMTELYTMPVPPQEGSQDFDYYQMFVRSMNRVSVKATGERLKGAIERTADACGTSPAHIARVLVEYGLRAPKHVFPADFVSFIDDRGRKMARLSFLNQHDEITELAQYWAGKAGVSSPAGTRVVEAV